MPWFYNSRTGAFAEEAGALGFLSVLGSKLGLGWHEYPTEQAMDAAIAQNHWPPPTTNPANPIGKTAVGSVEAGAPTAFRLVFGNTTGLLGRILKVGVGLVLIIAGALKITGAGKTLEQVLPVVGGPAGKLLSA
jgi:hypothetical protein